MFPRLFLCFWLFTLFTLCQAIVDLGQLDDELLKFDKANGKVVCLDKNKTIGVFEANSFYVYYKEPYEAIELNELLKENLSDLERELLKMLVKGIKSFMKIGSSEQKRIRVRLEENDLKLRVREADANKKVKMANFFIFASRLLSMVENNTPIEDLKKSDYATALSETDFSTLDLTQAEHLVGKKINLFIDMMFLECSKKWTVRYYLAIPTSSSRCRKRANDFVVPTFYEEPDKEPEKDQR